MFWPTVSLCRPCLFLSAALILSVAGSGCQRSEQIAHYRVPKEQEVSLPADSTEMASTADGQAAAENSSTSTEPDRMLAAIVPHGNTAWFFKLSGPSSAIGKQSETFDALVKSVTFPQSAGGKPQWKLPTGWEQKPGSQMRFATLVLPSEAATEDGGKSPTKPLEVSVTSLPWSLQGEADQLLANVNRWRGQMQLKPLTPAELSTETRSMALSSDAKLTATLVDLTGHMKAGGMQPPFAGAAAGGSSGKLPPGHPDLSNQMPPGHPPVADSSTNSRPPMAAAPAQDSDLPFTLTPPAGWKAAPLPMFAVAAFSLSENSPRPEVTITPLPEGAAGIEANISRWRDQLRLPPASASELRAAAKTYQVDGRSGHLVRLVGPEDATPRGAITAVVVSQDGVNWIFALKADADTAEKEQANFEKFVGSVKFRSKENSTEKK